MLYNVKPVLKITKDGFNHNIKIYFDYSPKVKSFKGFALVKFRRDPTMAIHKEKIDAVAENSMINFFKQNTSDLKTYKSGFIVSDVIIDEASYIKEKINLFKKNGWNIELDSASKYLMSENIKNVDDAEWYENTQLSSKNDWFDIDIGFELDGIKVPILPLMNLLLNNTEKNNTNYVYFEHENVQYKISSEKLNVLKNILNDVFNIDKFIDIEQLKIKKENILKLKNLKHQLKEKFKQNIKFEQDIYITEIISKLENFDSIPILETPINFNGELRPYQQIGLSWMQFLRDYKFNGILADDMGLGKTIQVISHMLFIKKYKPSNKPHLIVATRSLIYNWYNELQKFAPSLKVLVFSDGKRKEQFSQMINYDVVITTYGMLSRDRDELSQYEFDTIFADEAQNLKNSSSINNLSICTIKSEHRIALSGTPLENSLHDLHSIFNFLSPGMLGNKRHFTKKYIKTDEDKTVENNIQELRTLVKPFILRRLKTEVAKDLPDKIINYRYVELTGEQQSLYETTRSTAYKEFQEILINKQFDENRFKVLLTLLRLRQICCEPRLFTKDSLINYPNAKLNLLSNLIDDLKEEKKKIIIFSQFSSMFDYIEPLLKNKNINFSKITGKVKDRDTEINKFNNNETDIFLITLKAGGTGLNLQTADTVIHYDPWWNPHAEDQATDRAHRIGQKNIVNVFKLIAKSTIEEKVIKLQETKRQMADMLYGQDKNFDNLITKEEIENLLS